MRRRKSQEILKTRTESAEAAAQQNDIAEESAAAEPEQDVLAEETTSAEQGGDGRGLTANKVTI